MVLWCDLIMQVATLQQNTAEESGVYQLSQGTVYRGPTYLWHRPGHLLGGKVAALAQDKV